MTPLRSLHAAALAGPLLLSLLAGCATDPPPQARHRSPKPVPAPTPAPAPLPPTVSPSPAPLAGTPPPRIATASEVRDCKLVSRLGSLGPRRGESTSDSEARTRAEVLAKAGELRATHLVWGEAQFSYAPASSIGQAYRCAR